MNTATELKEPIPVLNALPVSPQHREAALATYSGRDSIRLMSTMLHLMSTLCRTEVIDGWHLYELTNGGFYMAPSDNSREWEIAYENLWDGDTFSAMLSADAAGIAVCLFAYLRLLDTTRDAQSERYSNLFSRLFSYACQHTESLTIKQALNNKEIEF